MTHPRLFFPIAIALTAALVACADEQEQAGELTEAVEEVAPALPPDLAAGLDEVGGSGVGGEATLTPNGDDELVVEVYLDGAIAEESYTAALHRGTCGDDQGAAVELGPLTVAGGRIGIETIIDRSEIEPGETYSLQVHDAAHTLMACANLVEPGLDASPAGAKTSVQGETY